MSYDDLFFDHIDAMALRSAGAVVEALYPRLRPSSVLDVGCGRGGWLRVWRQAGCPIVHGVDGDYVDRQRLFIEDNQFEAMDLSTPLDLGQRFDLVQCLEVGEHLPSPASPTLIESLIRHGNIVLFSAATPGQGGTHHINERPLEFWRKLFRDRGYHAYDMLRPLISGNTAIDPFYRYNTVLYASDATELSADIAATRVPDRQPLREYAPWPWLLRRLVLRNLPVSVIDRAAAINARLRHR